MNAGQSLYNNPNINCGRGRTNAANSMGCSNTRTNHCGNVPSNSRSGASNGSCGCPASSKELLKLIDETSFAAYDMLLYLDTHPDDEKAMAYYQKYSCMRKEYMKEYASQYGPLTIDLIDDACKDSQEWMMQPWPWEIKKKGRC